MRGDGGKKGGRERLSREGRRAGAGGYCGAQRRRRTEGGEARNLQEEKVVEESWVRDGAGGKKNGFRRNNWDDEMFKSHRGDSPSCSKNVPDQTGGNF